MDDSEIEKPSFLKKVQSAVFTIAAIMLSIGQWSDTKEMSVEFYEGFIAKFTDQIELDRLKSVKVGGNLEFIEQTFGIATLIKHSSQKTDLEYRYYPDSKYILTIAAQGNVIKGYQVISLDNTFSPNLPFTDKSLGDFSYTDFAPYYDEIRSDSANLVYYLEGQPLGRVGLFFNQFVTYVGYGAAYTEADVSKQQIIALNESLLQKGQEGSVEVLTSLRSQIKPNTFAVGDIDATTAADMLITRYEYAAYFKDE